jgi:DNA-binding CsgD family transcriptional regulator
MKSAANSPHAASVQQQVSAARVHLTPRQLEVLALLCEGLPNKLICRRLNIATGTVKIHISCILRELGVTSRLQAALFARRCGLLDDPAVSESDEGGDYAGAAGYPATAGPSEYRTSHELAAA